jgi:prepilin-type N-terminal cleavage/methylation domain-containing protein
MRGYSLLELIVVLAAAGLLAALVAPSFSGSLESARLRAGAAEVRATLARARSLAATEGRERTVFLDFDHAAYGVAGEGGRLSLPEGIRFSRARVGDLPAESGEARLKFHPDGSAVEAEVELSAPGGATARVTVDPLTGIAEASR